MVAITNSLEFWDFSNSVKGGYATTMSQRPTPSDADADALREIMKDGKKEMGITIENSMEDRIERLKQMERLKRKLAESEKGKR